MFFCLITGIFIIGIAFYHTHNKGEIISISKEELRGMIDSKRSFYVYVGRPNCPDCQEFYPKLKKRVYSHRITIYYFNTKVKVSKKQEMKDFVNSMGINEIPAIIEVDKGEIIRVYDGQNKEEMDELYARIKEK